MSISAIILTHNSEYSIAGIIKSLNWCDEVIIIDDDSIDQTRQIAKRFGAVIYSRSLDNDFASQRNFGLSKAKSEWVLFVDSDELVTEELAQEIQVTIQTTEYDGFFIPRVDEWKGKQLTSGEFHTSLVRLGRYGVGIWTRSVHEVWNIENAGQLSNPIIHKPHPTVYEFIADINWYSSLHAKEKRRVYFLYLAIFPWLKFIFNFFFKLGFRDGTHGFVAAMIMSFHSFLGWSKAWKA